MVSRDFLGQGPAIVRRSSLEWIQLSALAALLIGAGACGSSKGQEGAQTAGTSPVGGAGTVNQGNAGGTEVKFRVGATGGETATGGTTQQVSATAPAVCGNGLLESGELCDDGNTASGDGCTADCSAVELNYVCPNPGQPCILAMVCGDKKITGTETCDDGNIAPGDGCSDTCQLEHGWVCPAVGAACRAAKCGDSVIARGEMCDDGNSTSGDGCSSSCQIESGYVCSAAGEACIKTVCGNGAVEGTEECDDGNLIPYDGCSPTCTIEPSCSNGTCTAVCGDGLKFPQEGCDDGNTRSGDGCSSDCEVERGYECKDATEDPSATLAIPILYRDFLYVGTPAGSGHPEGHPDFENPLFVPGGACTIETTGLVQPKLGSDGKPSFLSSTGDNTCRSEITSADTFASWYHESPLNKVVPATLTLSRQAGSSTYSFSSSSFFPINDLGWQTADYCGGMTPTTTDCQANVPSPNTTNTPAWCSQWANQCADYGNPVVSGNNFSFTSELRYPFTYQGGEVFSFTGDDDVWAFVNGVLAVDLGGVHIQVSKSVTLDPTAAQTFGLSVGGMYEIALFQAERHVTQSNYKLTLAGFDHTTSVCTSICGDAVVTPDEACDLGTDNNTGAYGGCNPDCTMAPYCGDHMTQADQGEQCDDGVNLATYWYTGTPEACGTNCKKPDYCGDGIVDSLFGEQCDNGTQVIANGCSSNCMIGSLCGNGVLDPGEECDDGNTSNGDSCSQFCKSVPPLPG